MTQLGMMAEVFEVLVRLTSAYIAGKIKREEFLKSWAALGHGVELVAKDMDRPITIGRLAASRGGRRGGPIRMESLSASERSELARHAANERWLG